MKPRLLIPILATAVLIGIGYAYHHHSSAALPDYIAHSNGRLELKRLDLASLYPGRVQAVRVDEGSEVQAGDVLVELTSASASAQLEAAQAQKQRAQEAVARADAEIQAYEQQQKVAQMELGNAQHLKRDGLVSAAEVARRQAARDGAAASVRAARAARAEAAAAVAAAQAQINQAASAHADMTIRSPTTGRVEYTIAEVGSVIAPGSTVVSVLDPSDVSMNIFLPNLQAGRLQVGDEARIVLDSVDAVFPAKISFIASEAQFTPKAVETANEREKLVFKVKLKLAPATAVRYQRLLKGGMTGNGYVRTDAAQAWPSALAVKLPHE